MSKNGKPKRQKVKAIDADKLPVLPSKWCWATLNDLAALEPNSITDGPFGSNLKTSHYTEEGPRVIRLQNIGDGEFIDEKAHIAEDHFQSLARHHIKPGDVAIAALGETLPRSCVIPDWVGAALVKADCPRFRPNTEAVLAEYVNFALNSPETRQRTSTIIHGVGRPRLNLSEIRGTWLPVAPVNEQKRIVSKIEELFSDLDAGVAALERAKANLKRYRAAVLKAAVEGKLTEEWRTNNPPTEPADQLLKRILEERRKKWEEQQLLSFEAKGKKPPKNWRGKYKEPAAPDTANLPALPEGWCWATPEQIASTDSYSLAIGPFGSNLKVSDYTDQGVPLIFVRNIRSGIFGGANTHFVSETKAGELAAHSVDAGDILITKMGDPPGDARLYPVGQPHAIITADCIKLRTSRFIKCPQFFVHAINSQLVHPQIMSITRGVAQKKVSLGRFATICLPVPPHEEQTEIVTRLEECFSIADASGALIDTTLKRSSRLRQSILKRAFEGKLVPQNPSDEPADELLGRIREQRRRVQNDGSGTNGRKRKKG